MTNNIIIILNALLVFTACSVEDDQINIAKVDNLKISAEEFSLRYNFNPHLAKYKNEKNAKKIILSTLIAEKILALEADKLQKCDENLESLIEQKYKEAMIEQYRRDMIENNIQLSKSELQSEYKKSQQEIDIKFVAFNSKQDAERIKNIIDSGISFDNAIRDYMVEQGWNDEEIPSKTVKWNTEPYELENEIFSIGINKVSQPIFAYGDYYLIKVNQIKQVITPSTSDFQKHLPALRDRILRKKIKDQYTKLYKDKIENKLGSINWNKIQTGLSLIVKEISFNKAANEQNRNQFNKPLSDDVYLSYAEKISDIKNDIVISFNNNESWNFNELVKKLKYGPFSFNYRNEKKFINSFVNNVRLVIELEAIYQLAGDAGYREHEYVNGEVLMWKAYYTANDFRYHLIQNAETEEYDDNANSTRKKPGKQQIEKFRIQFFDEYLSEKCENYDIKINKKLYESLSLNKTDMMVMKKHFAHRMIVPMTEPLVGLPRWMTRMDSVFKIFEIS